MGGCSSHPGTAQSACRQCPPDGGCSCCLIARRSCRPSRSAHSHLHFPLLPSVRLSPLSARPAPSARLDQPPHPPPSQRIPLAAHSSHRTVAVSRLRLLRSSLGVCGRLAAKTNKLTAGRGGRRGDGERPQSLAPQSSAVTRKTSRRIALRVCGWLRKGRLSGGTRDNSWVRRGARPALPQQTLTQSLRLSQPISTR